MSPGSPAGSPFGGSTAAGRPWPGRIAPCPSTSSPGELAPGYDLQAEPWLFRRLTRTLDRRMLALLASPGELAAAGPFSVTLNIASLLGADFLRFDAALPTPLRGRVSVALNPADLVADARSFAVRQRLRPGPRLPPAAAPEHARLAAALSPAAAGVRHHRRPLGGASPAARQATDVLEPLTARIRADGLRHAGRDRLGAGQAESGCSPVPAAAERAPLCEPAAAGLIPAAWMQFGLQG